MIEMILQATIPDQMQGTRGDVLINIPSPWSIQLSLIKWDEVDFGSVSVKLHIICNNMCYKK
jgi:hypothetical protein